MVGIGPHGNRRRLVGPVMNEIYYVATDIDLVSGMTGLNRKRTSQLR